MSETRTAIPERDEWAKALGGEYGGKVSADGLTWGCVCGANGTGGVRGLYIHRRGQTCNGSDRTGGTDGLG